MSQIVSNVLVVGNSLIGSLYRAYEHHGSPSGTVTFSFLGAAEPNFQKIAIAQGRVEGASVASPKASRVLNDYNFVVFYANLPSPHNCALLEQQLISQGFTSAVILATIEDKIRNSKPFRLFEKCSQSSRASALLLSANTHLGSPIISKESRIKGEETIAKVVGVNQYIRPPQELFDQNDLPKVEYYKDSVYIMGEKARPELHPDHDNFHMNELGGRLLLIQIEEHIKRNW